MKCSTGSNSADGRRITQRGPLHGWYKASDRRHIAPSDMDRFQLTRRLKRDPPMRDVIIVALTAYAMKGDEQRAVEAGCDGYIAKPLDTRALPALILGYLTSRRGTQRKGGLRL